MNQINQISLSGFIWLEQLAKWDGTNFSPLKVPEAILKSLGNPQNKYETIHIAGTNGKGTVASLINHVLVDKKDYSKVGLMTSPHLRDVTERVKINSKNIEEELFDISLLEVKLICEKLKVVPTYFVAITCAAFLVFANQEIEIAVIEVGLGGKYDATNLMSAPLFSVITSIGLDHQDRLGYSIKEIAEQKAGIIKSGTEVVIGNLPIEADEVVIKIAHEKGVKVFKADVDFGFNLREEIFKFSELKINFKPDEINLNKIPKYLLDNFSIATFVLLKLGIALNDIIFALKTYNWDLRFSIWKFVSDNCKYEIIADGAHNVDGINAFFDGVLSYIKAENLQLSNTSNINTQVKLRFFCFFLSRKDWRSHITLIDEFCNKNKNFNIEIFFLKLSKDFVDPNILIETLGQGGLINLSDLEKILKPNCEYINNSNVINCFFGSLNFPSNFHNILLKLGYHPSTIWC